MKIKNRLLPILSTISAGTLLTCSTLTSCSNWVRFTDMMNFNYKTGVKPLGKISFYNSLSDSIYYLMLRSNHDIIRDDIFYTYSQMFHDSECRTATDNYIQYSKFILDISVEERTESLSGLKRDDYFSFRVEAEVAGTVANAISTNDETYKLKKFDLRFDVLFDGLTKFEFFEKNPFKLKDYYIGQLSIGETDIIDAYVDGSYTYTTQTNNAETTVDDAEDRHIVSYNEWENDLVGQLFNTTVSGLTRTVLAETDSPTNEGPEEELVPIFWFVSPYFRNAVIEFE